MIKTKNAHFDIAIDAFDETTIICLKCIIIFFMLVTDSTIFVTKVVATQRSNSTLDVQLSCAIMM